ncbi:hypothetical protein [Parerythrobacter jejuensis]|uniref:Uncharacterized protein n=1 Tax=Parerythrobacter jejuensis TaxID=795812 RepID=A0A845ANS5_9SPHN|nr:hypothetical protein [Parerythrobacter jejuensis]MXP32462.1 hypothetical protein [Parerythrobacter jejuensis]
MQLLLLVGGIFFIIFGVRTFYVDAESIGFVYVFGGITMLFLHWQGRKKAAEAADPGEAD